MNPPSQSGVFVADTPAQRRGAALLGLDLSALPHPSFTAAHRAVLYDIATDALDAFDLDHQADAALLAGQFAVAIGWQEPTTADPDQQPTVYGPTHRGTRYSIRRLDTAAPSKGQPDDPDHVPPDYEGELTRSGLCGHPRRSATP